MKHGYFAIFGCACLLGLALISCDPVGAAEIGVDDQTGIYDYLDTGAQNLQQIDFSLDFDEDGNRSVRLKIYGLQKLAFSEQTAFYDNLDFGSAPDTTTVSGSAASGLYTYNGAVQPVSVSVFSSSGSKIVCSAPDFTMRYIIPDGATCSVFQSENSTSYLYNCFAATSDFPGSEFRCSGIFSGYSTQIFQNISNQLAISKTAIPTLSPGNISRNSYTLIGGLGVNFSLPSGTVDTSKPWDYYNNVLLPYMEEEFPGYDDYFVFPDGYNPPEPPPQVPTEFPTLPGYDFDIQPNGTLPADAGNTAYDMPDVPVKVVPVPSFDLTKINPAEIISPFASGLQGIWALISDTLVSFDLLPVVSLCFLVLIITAFLALGVK